MKTCKRCEEDKETNLFPLYSNGSMKRRPVCKKCTNEANKHVRRKYMEGTGRLKKKEWDKKSSSKHRKELKYKVMSHYSKGALICACPGCLDPHLEFLTIDHIKGGGTRHRREIGPGSTEFYKWLIKSGFPSGFQVLCFNCNFAKHAFGVCPHTKEAAI